MKDDNVLYSLYNEYDVHPFYFRPTKEFINRSGNTTTKMTLIDNVKLRTVGPGHGLIWSSNEISPQQKTTIEKKVVTKINKNSPEQSFGALITDKFYLLSTDTNDTGQSIHFDELNKYELTQEDYISKIDPKTYSVVRGEVLLEIIYAIISVLTSHVHNINDPYARQDYPQHNRLMKLLEQLENDLMNKSIRIN